MNFREKFIFKTGGLLAADFEETAGTFGGGGIAPLEKLNRLLIHARGHLREYDAACTAAGVGRGGLASLDELGKLPRLGRGDLAGKMNLLGNRRPMARLESGGTGRAGKVETALDLKAVVKRYAVLLAVLKTTGWRMGEKTVAFHPAEYGYFNNLGAMFKSRAFSKIFFEFFQQYVLYRLFHNRKNLYYDGLIFYEPGAPRALLEKALNENPVLIITRPDALMAVLKILRGRPAPVFKRLKAVLTVGTVLGETVRKEAREKFGAEVFNMYASTELGYAALGCAGSGGWLHINEADYLVETGGEKEIIATDFNNRLMPMLRYGTGDIGETALRACACGRRGSMLKISGRKDKFIGNGRGERLYEADVIDRTFPADLPFFQVIAEKERKKEILLCGGNARGDEATAADIADRLGLEKEDYSFRQAERFKIPASGKFCFLP
ncbi:MAG: hypothetical protein NTX59_08025 [Elusimicrobia bacterium]|nr:hypothetical protein [Elusimicrobiota bacterium]